MCPSLSAPGWSGNFLSPSVLDSNTRSWAVCCFCLKFIWSLEILHSWASSCRGFLSCGVIGRLGEIHSPKYTAVPLAKMPDCGGAAWVRLPMADRSWVSRHSPHPRAAEGHPTVTAAWESAASVEGSHNPRSCSGHVQKPCVLQEGYRPPLGSLDGQLPSLLAPQHHPELCIVAGPEAIHELASNTNACFPLALNKKPTISNCQYPSPERHATALLLRAYSPLLYLEQFEKSKFLKINLSKSSPPTSAPLPKCSLKKMKKEKFIHSDEWEFKMEPEHCNSCKCSRII